MMNKNEIQQIHHFLIRPGMYINPTDKNNILSFIFGYEAGLNNRNFTNEIIKLLEEKYKIPFLSMGWIGQIDVFALKKKCDWIVAFKQIGLEIILQQESYDLELKEYLKLIITRLLKDVNEEMIFQPNWKDQWLSYCLINNKDFKKLWTKKEFSILKNIHREVKNNNFIEIKLSPKFFEMKNSFRNS